VHLAASLREGADLRVKLAGRQTVEAAILIHDCLAATGKFCSSAMAAARLMRSISRKLSDASFWKGMSGSNCRDDGALIVTVAGKEYEFDQVFVRQIKVLGQSGNMRPDGLGRLLC